MGARLICKGRVTVAVVNVYFYVLRYKKVTIYNAREENCQLQNYLRKCRVATPTIHLVVR
jgi:hypothetical protein